MQPSEVIVADSMAPAMSQSYREAAAERIKALMVTWTSNTLELGDELTRAAKTFPLNARGEPIGFRSWARKATGLSDSQVYNLINVYRKFGNRAQKPRLAQNVMVTLAAKGVPESARLEALSRSEKGEHIGNLEARKIAKVHKLPAPKQANEQAKQEGRPVLARDGFIYFGTDPGRAKEGEDRRTMVYGVRRALDTLAGINLTPKQFLQYAMPHQLWDAEEGKVIKQALRWLADLDHAWDNRE